MFVDGRAGMTVQKIIEVPAPTDVSEKDHVRAAIIADLVVARRTGRGR
jgi:hypothetical protein